MKVCSIGIGLIGGSFALALKEHYAKAEIWGMDSSTTHLQEAVELGIIEGVARMNQITDFDLVVISIPVDAIPAKVNEVLPLLNKNALVIDMGSTKKNICEQLENHPRRNQFLATHPIAGTEFSGPKASLSHLFEGALMIVCEAELTRKDLRQNAFEIFQQMGMQLQLMQAKAHDQHLAYVSHLSHISSFMLGKTVLDLEKDEREIFRLAGSGFASTVRLAKSNPTTWSSIFKENKAEVLKSLRAYQANLSLIEEALNNEDEEAVMQLLNSTSRIREIIK